MRLLPRPSGTHHTKGLLVLLATQLFPDGGASIAIRDGTDKKVPCVENPARAEGFPGWKAWSDRTGPAFSANQQPDGSWVVSQEDVTVTARVATDAGEGRFEVTISSIAPGRQRMACLSLDDAADGNPDGTRHCFYITQEPVSRGVCTMGRNVKLVLLQEMRTGVPVDEPGD